MSTEIEIKQTKSIASEISFALSNVETRQNRNHHSGSALQQHKESSGDFLIDNSLKPFSFEDRPDNIFLSNKYTTKELSHIFSRVNIYNDTTGKLPPRESKNIINFLAKNGGNAVRNLFGYKPHNHNGLPDYKLEDNLFSGRFVFGRIYTPNIKGFSALIHIQKEENESSHFKVKVPYFSSSFIGELEVKIDQELDISDSVDLILPATYKTVRWQNNKGNYFYITELHSKAQLITTRKANNPYLDQEGFKKLQEKSGIVNVINPKDYKENSGPSFSIERNETFNVGFEFPMIDEIYLPECSGNYKATSKQLVEIKYSIPRKNNYVMFNALNGDNSRFEHYWSSAGQAG